MRNLRPLSILAAAALAFGLVAPAAPTPAWAGGPVAVVEEVNAAASGLRSFDFVAEGRRIDLGNGGTLTLGYLGSCVHENITGGVVTVGARQSEVRGGTVQREIVECDGGALRLTAAQADKSAVAVFRATPSAKDRDRPRQTVYAVSPLILVGPGVGKDVGEVSIQRLDRPGSVRSYWASHAAVDLAALGVSLAANGVYRIRAGKADTVIRIDPLAAPGTRPLISRLVTLAK